MLLKDKLHDIKCEIKWAWQRVVRGYDDRATWNLDWWFLEYVPKILKHLNEDRCGHPYGMTDAQWGKTLDKMIECFTEANELTCTKENKYQKDYDEMYKRFNESCGMFGELLPQPEDIKPGFEQAYFPDSKEVGRKEWQVLTKKYHAEANKIDKYRDKKLQEGLELFTKHFRSLWD